MTTDWKALRYGIGAIKTSLVSVTHTMNDALSDIDLSDDERWGTVFGDLRQDLTKWIEAMESNIKYCKGKEA